MEKDFFLTRKVSEIGVVKNLSVYTVIKIFVNLALEFPKITKFTVFRAHRRQTDQSAAVSRHKRFVQSKSSLLLSLSDTASRTSMSRMSSSCMSSFSEVMSSRSVSVLGQDPSGKFFAEKRKDGGGRNLEKIGKEEKKEMERKEEESIYMKMKTKKLKEEMKL